MTATAATAESKKGNSSGSSSSNISLHYQLDMASIIEGYSSHDTAGCPVP